MFAKDFESAEDRDDENCVTTMSDGTGTTSYAYNSVTVPAALGATRLASVDGPLADDTIAFSYDELGRELNHAVNGAADSVTYDSLGRVSSATNALGSFTYGYVDVTGRLASVSAPNGETTAYSYYPNEGDKQLQTLQNFQAGGSNRSRFDYAYDQEHMIVEWDKQVDADESAPLYFDYDGADQLIDWTNNRDTGGGISGSMQSYVYDAAGNRQSDTYQAWPGSGASWATNNTQSWTANSLNELTTVQGPAPTPTPGPGPIHKREGEQPPPPPPTTFSYDGNGNTTQRVYSNGSGNSFEWDAANRLTAITYSGNTNRTEFTYDGLSRRVKIIEKNDGTVTSTKQFVWNGMRIAEERDGDNTVTRRYYSQGEERVGGSDAGVYYYTRDHLGSIRELTDPAGSLRARYDYDPFGNTTKVSGDLSVDFGYTGHYYHAASNLYLAPYRAYDPTIGRWLSRDPVGERHRTMNLYSYVSNNPTNRVDKLGLIDTWPGPAPGEIRRIPSLPVISQLVDLFLDKVDPPFVPDIVFPIGGCSLAYEACVRNCATEYGACPANEYDRHQRCEKRCKTLYAYCKDTQR